MNRKQVTVSLSEIKETFVIRLGLNQAHLDHLRALVETGVKLPHLLISLGDNELIDGRHRLAVYRSIGHSRVTCWVESFASDADKVARALECNVGGSLPPTEADITHTMQVFLSTGATRKYIIDIVSSRVGFPKPLVKKYLDQVQSQMGKVRLKKAVSDVVDHHKTVTDSAISNGVKLETLKAALKSESKHDPGVTDVAMLKSHFSCVFRSLGHTIGRRLSMAAQNLSDGVIENGDVEEIIVHTTTLVERLNHLHEEWVKRFELQGKSVEKANNHSMARTRKTNDGSAERTLARMGLL